MVRHLSGKLCASVLAGLSALVLIAAAPSQALAGERDRHDYRDRGDRYRDHYKGDHRGGDVRIDVRLGEREPIVERRETRVWVEPVYRTVADRVWVEPVYRTVHERVWREPEYRDEHDRVWVPDRWDVRERTYRDECGRRVIRRERVLVEPAHWEVRRHRVLVCEGRWETIERRELVCEGYWKNVHRQECVSPGHWEYRTEHVAVHERGWGDPLIDIRARFER